MRLRLVIFRHDLPPTRILWTTPPSSLPPEQPSAPSSFTVEGAYAGLPTSRAGSVSASATTVPTAREGGALASSDSSYTIAHLLQDVNQVVPLETHPDNLSDDEQSGNHCGLENYVVELWGSECLHFMDTNSLLRDGDEAVIRPLQAGEMSERRMTDRHQVSRDGTRLIDGVPFGQPYVKPSDPAKLPAPMPQRKRRRIDQTDLEHDESVATANRTTADRQRDESQPSRKRRIVAVTEDGQLAQESAANSSTLPQQQVTRQTPPKERDKEADAKSVSTSSSSSVGSEDESSDTNSSSSGSTSSSSTSSSPSSDESSVSESEVEATPKSKASHPKTQNKSGAEPTAVNPPGMGNSRTRNSNLRNKLRRKLQRMKDNNILSKNANFADMKAFEASHPGTTGRAVGAEGTESEFQEKRARLLRDIESGGVDVTVRTAKDNAPATEEGPEPQEVKNETSAVGASTEAQSQKRQKKLDMGGARRLLFGSLGIRTPKTKADEERARDKLATKAQPPNWTIKLTAQNTQEIPDRDTLGLEPVDNWQDYLILKATECVHDNVELSEPPFPFVQRWNGEDQEAIRACRRNNNNNNTTSRGSKGKGRKRKSRTSVGESTNAVYGEYEEGETNAYDNGDMLLDYGEDSHTADPKGAATQAIRVEMTSQPFDSAVTDDLPPLPDNISTRAIAKEDEVGQGAVVAFKQLDVSKETNWEPVVSGFRTAQVEAVLENSVLGIRLAVRDRTQQSRSEDEGDGPRVYTKFEMPGYAEGDEEDDGVREVAFREMIEPKLLRPGGSSSSS